MLTPEAAWAAISSRLEVLEPRDVALAEATHRRLARSLTATVDMPPADMSAMDGYACGGDVEAGATLPVAGMITAGAPSAAVLAAGEAVKIMTGAVVPEGADRVIPVEETDGGGQRVVFHRAPPPGQHIRRGGEVVRRGQPLLAAGALLTPGAISLLASHGYTRTRVHRQPSVAVLATGDELVPPEASPGPGQLRDSNSSFLLSALRATGLAPRALGIAPDRPDALRRQIIEGLSADVLLLCGGVSMGELDLVEGVLDELGCEQLFDKVAIQPGKPLVAARHERGWVFGLPGNPASVMVTFWLFVRPLLRRLQGSGDSFWHGALAGELAAPLPGSKARDRFLSASARFSGGALRVTPHLPQGSHDVIAYAHGTALVRIRPRAAPASPGTACEILPLGDWLDGVASGA